MAEQPPVGAAVPRRPDARMWLVFSFFFFSLVAGTVMLFMIWFYPNAPLWMDIAGLIICTLPWLFWLFTFLYRLIFHGGSSNYGGKKPTQPIRTATVAPAPITDSSPAATKQEKNDGDECVGQMGTIDVRWAQAVLMDIDEDEDDQVHMAENRGAANHRDVTARQREGSSHDSEKPLAFSMAS